MTILYKHAKKPKNNKSWELQIDFGNKISAYIDLLTLSIERDYKRLSTDFLSIFGLYIAHSKKHDHAGWDIQITLFGLWISYNYYDIRHWDEENNKWEEYEGENT